MVLQGQICLCGSRLFVQRSIFDSFVSKFVEKVKAIQVMGRAFGLHSLYLTSRDVDVARSRGTRSIPPRGWGRL